MKIIELKSPKIDVTMSDRWFLRVNFHARSIFASFTSITSCIFNFWIDFWLRTTISHVVSFDQIYAK